EGSARSAQRARLSALLRVAALRRRRLEEAKRRTREHAVRMQIVVPLECLEGVDRDRVELAVHRAHVLVERGELLLDLLHLGRIDFLPVRVVVDAEERFLCAPLRLLGSLLEGRTRAGYRREEEAESAEQHATSGRKAHEKVVSSALQMVKRRGC